MKLQEIDGSELEGGGQIVRQAVMLSCLMKKSIRIRNIRAGRKKAGLREQHLAGIRLVRDLMKCNIEGDALHAAEIVIRNDSNQEIKENFYECRLQGAGSTLLILQMIVPLCLYQSKTTKVELIGGTDGDFAPPFDWYKNVYIATLQRLVSCRIEMHVESRGFVPLGGGKLQCTIQGSTKQPISSFEMIERGELNTLLICIGTSGPTSQQKSEELEKSLLDKLKKEYSHCEIKAENTYDSSSSLEAIVVSIIATTTTKCGFGVSHIAGKRWNASQIVRELVKKFTIEMNHKGCVDSYLQDQLVWLMALAQGRSKLRTGPLTLHTRTSIAYLLPQLTGVQFDITSDPQDGTYLIECQGSGFVWK